MKRVRKIIAVLLAVLVSATAVAEPLCISTEEAAALLLEDGTELAAPGVYDDIFPLIVGERYAVGRSETGKVRYALADASGNMLTELRFDMLSPGVSTILFRENGFCGAMTPDGSEILAPVYTQIVEAENGSFLAITGDPYDDSADEVLLVSPEGEALTTGIRAVGGLNALVSDRMLYRDPISERYGYLDSEGRVAVEAAFEYAGTFENGFARASERGLLGVIDRSGAWRIMPRYDFLAFGDGIIVCLEAGEVCIVYDAETCTERYRIEGTNLRAATVGGYVVVVDDRTMTLYDADGVILVTLEPDATVFPGAGRQLLLSDGDWGSECIRIIRQDGTLSAKRYQHLLPLDERMYASMTMRVAAYFSDALGEIRYSCDYDSMRFGLMDSDGNELLPAEYLEIRALGENRYLAVSEDGMRIVDGAGETIWSRVEETDE